MSSFKPSSKQSTQPPSSESPSLPSLISSLLRMDSVSPAVLTTATNTLTAIIERLKGINSNGGGGGGAVGSPVKGRLSAGAGAMLLSWAFSAMDHLQPIYKTDISDFVVSTSSNDQLSIRPLALKLSLGPASKHELQLLCLEAIKGAISALAKLDAFSVWGAVLGESSLSPFKLSLLDLINLPYQTSVSVPVQVKVLEVVQCFVDRAGSFFNLIEKPKSSGRGGSSSSISFTPLYQGLSQALEQAHYSIVATVKRAKDLSFVTAATRALACLLRKCPYAKLNDNVLVEVSSLTNSLQNFPNPVAQIAGLNLAVPLLAAVTTLGEKTEEYEKDISHRLMMVAFSSSSSSTSMTTDNNVRYVALQGLGQITALRLSALSANMDVLTRSLEDAMSDRDPAIALHTLRFLKLLAKNEAGARKAGSGASPSSQPPSFLRFWSGFLKPRIIQLIEGKGEHSLRAALCDTLSDIGEDVHLKLQVEKRMLCVTYLLSHCTDSEVSVRTAAFRGIGMILAFQDSQTDVPFLVDCTDRILGALVPRAHKNVVMSATWALSNLCDALVVLKEDGSGLLEEFPQHELFRLTEVSTKYVAEEGSHLSIKVNCLRSLGCLLLCTESALSDADVRDSPDVAGTVNDALACVTKCVRSSSSMKVRWNAGYAIGKAIQNGSFSQAQYADLLCAIESAIRGCKNYKVRINAASALLHLSDRGRVGAAYLPLCDALVSGLDKVNAAAEENNDDETQHRLDLVEVSFLAWCRLITLGSLEDLSLASRAISNSSSDWLERTEDAIESTRRLVSPERASIFIEASTHLRSVGVPEEDVMAQAVARLL